MTQTKLAVTIALLVLFLAWLTACAPRSMRVEFSCVSYQAEGKILTDCADMQTWKDWAAEQMKEQPGQEL